MKEPVRLGKVETPSTMEIDFKNWMLLHPSAIILGICFALFILGALVWCYTGHSAVESGGMRNFLARGV